MRKISMLVFAGMAMIMSQQCVCGDPGKDRNDKLQKMTAVEIVKVWELDKYPPGDIGGMPNRYDCASDLGKTKDPKAIDILLSMLSNEKEDPAVRQMAIESLTEFNKAGLIKNDGFLVELKKIIKEKGDLVFDYCVRGNAIKELYNQGDESIALNVADELAKRDKDAIFVFPGDIQKDKKLQAMLLKALDYKDDEIVIMAVDRLLFLEDKDIRKKAYKAFLRIKIHERDLKNPKEGRITDRIKGIEEWKLKKEDKE